MKRYDMVISFQEKKTKLKNLVSKKGIKDKAVISLSRKLDKLQNKLYEV